MKAGARVGAGRQLAPSVIPQIQALVRYPPLVPGELPRLGQDPSCVQGARCLAWTCALDGRTGHRGWRGWLSTFP